MDIEKHVLKYNSNQFSSDALSGVYVQYYYYLMVLRIHINSK
jgi:hypothetical protein